MKKVQYLLGYGYAQSEKRIYTPKQLASFKRFDAFGGKGLDWHLVGYFDSEVAAEVEASTNLSLREPVAYIIEPIDDLSPLGKALVEEASS